MTAAVDRPITPAPYARPISSAPYAYHAWRSNLTDDSPIPPALFLKIACEDVLDAARRHGIDIEQPVQFWTHPEWNLKAFFIGDTSLLPGEGWVHGATL